jgi:hypothetical protein
MSTVAQKPQRLGAAFGAVAAGVGRHQDIGAETLCRLRDPVVVGGHVDGIEAPDPLRRDPGPLDQAARLTARAAQHGQRLARKPHGRESAPG